MQTDIAIIGAGPAGLTAAIYAKRSGHDVIVFEKMLPGGQMNTTPDVANYPGLPDIDGYALSTAMKAQVNALGVEVKQAEITSITHVDCNFLLNHALRARSVIYTTGATRRRLGIEGEAENIGKGVAYCAVCDGHFFKDKPVAIVGGGTTALEDALFLAKLCPEVHLVHRRHEFRAGQLLQEQILNTPNIMLHLGCTPIKITGSPVEQLHIQSDNNDVVALSVAAVFIAIGSVAESRLIADLIQVDEQGRVVAGEDCKTTIPGLFAAGDVRKKPLYQIVTAAADGANAAVSAGLYLDSLISGS